MRFVGAGRDQLDEFILSDVRAELALADGLPENGFIKALKLYERKARRYHLPSRSMGERLAQQMLEVLPRQANDFTVIEGQTRLLARPSIDVAHGVPPSICRIVAGDDHVRLGHGEANVCNAHGMPARVASGIAEGTQLVQPHARQAGFFFKLPARSLLEWLVLVDEASRERPVPLKRWILALDEENSEIVGAHREKHDVDRDGGAGESVRKGHAPDSVVA